MPISAMPEFKDIASIKPGEEKLYPRVYPRMSKSLWKAIIDQAISTLGVIAIWSRENPAFVKIQHRNPQHILFT